MKKQFSKLCFLCSKESIVKIATFGVTATVILFVAVLPIAKHVKIAASFATQSALAERPDVMGVPLSGEVDLEYSGGYPVNGEPLGSVKIGGTSVDCTLYYGDDAPQLHVGAGIWAGGKIPGQNGTVLVAGHTNTFFRDLESVQEGADVLVQTRYGEYHYKVTGTRIAKEDDTSAYDLEAERDNMILYTCYPFGQTTVTDQRYFVYADYVSGPQVKEVTNEK